MFFFVNVVEPIHALSLVDIVVYEILLVYGKCGGKLN